MYEHVTKCKFMCPTHGEAKQTKISEFRAEKALLQGHARIGWLVPPKPQTLKQFQQAC